MQIKSHIFSVGNFPSLLLLLKIPIQYLQNFSFDRKRHLVDLFGNICSKT